MIIKILSSAKNFEGIDYSERKNDQGKSQLLKANNFDGLGHHFNEIKKADYINYMKMVCDSNPKVKKRQFHAIISAKGQSYSSEQLLQIAENFLKNMGYGENPYIIYNHSDTAHNHVHMVSTRVNKNGKKVDDSYEKIRSQKVLKRILGQDAAKEVKAILEKASNYNFSTMAQFRLLLEYSGIKVTVDNSQLNLIKYGIVQHSIEGAEIKQKIRDYQRPHDRIKQLSAIFTKYKTGRNLDTFQQLLHQKFGIQLVLHQKKGKEMPYGYTVIDHSRKEVFKGSEILKLRELVMPGSHEETLELFKEICDRTNFEKVSFTQFRRDISFLGLSIDKNGIISSENGRLINYDIPLHHLEKMKYHSRVECANSFTSTSDREKSALAGIFKIKEKDLVVSANYPEGMISYYRNIYAVLDQTSSPEDVLKKNMITIAKYRNNLFLMDSRHKIIIDLNQIGKLNKPIPLWVIDYDEKIKNEPNRETKLLKSSAEFIQLLFPELDLKAEDHRPKRKRRNLFKS